MGTKEHGYVRMGIQGTLPRPSVVHSDSLERKNNSIHGGHKYLSHSGQGHPVSFVKNQIENINIQNRLPIGGAFE
jgi:hypothetical protein